MPVLLLDKKIFDGGVARFRSCVLGRSLQPFDRAPAHAGDAALHRLVPCLAFVDVLELHLLWLRFLLECVEEVYLLLLLNLEQIGAFFALDQAL